MMTVVSDNRRVLKAAVLAGLTGGVAEIAWVALYSSAAGARAADVARGITATVLPFAADAPWAPWAGVGIHLALSAALGLAFVLALGRYFATAPAAWNIWFAALVALTGVWAANFLVILPALNPVFVKLMPYGATLASKLLFAVAMAGVLQRRRAVLSTGARKDRRRNRS